MTGTDHATGVGDLPRAAAETDSCEPHQLRWCLTKIEAGGGAVGVAGVEAALMEDGGSPGAFAEAGVTGELGEAFWRCFGDDEGAVVGEDEEFVLGDDEGALEVFLCPDGFAGGGVDATEKSLRFFFVDGAVEAVEVAAVAGQSWDQVDSWS